MPNPKPHPKCNVVPFRLPQKEYEALREFADSHGLRISDVCRTAVTGYIETVGRLREQNKAQQIT